MNLHQHQRLQAPRNIRIISLEGARSFTAPLRCTLSQVSLDQNTPYEALSYSWESHQGEGVIRCDNAPLKITANCELAMRHLRPKSGCRTLWIDAICIDQTSITDKNQQIPLMREIYGLAKEVIVWLGPESKRSDTWLTMIRRFADMRAYREDHPEPLTSLHQLVRGLVLIASRNKIPSPIPNGQSSKSTAGNPTFDLLARSVFERMWCLQEVAFARSARVLCGRSSITWEQLTRGITIQGKFSMGKYQRREFNLFQDRIMLQTVLKENVVSKPLADRRLSLSWLLASTSTRGATDPRDKVFALHGFFQAMQIPIPQPDYAKPVEQVYLETAHAAINWDSNLDLLYQVAPSKHTTELPSWIPDFSNGHRVAFISHSSYNASQNSPCRWNLNGNSLSVYGYTIDQIHDCAQMLDDSLVTGAHGTTSETFAVDMASESWYNTLKQWLSLALSIPNYPTKESVEDAFARTLLTDPLIDTQYELEIFSNIINAWRASLTSSSSKAAFMHRRISDILEDLAGLPTIPPEKREFGQKMVAISISNFIGAITLGSSLQVHCLHYWLALTHLRRALFVTNRGWMGILPAMAQKGDLMVLLSGLRTPFVMRNSGNDTVRLVGPAYAHGVMNGALWEDNRPLQEFKIV